jgi:biotin operon repressor
MDTHKQQIIEVLSKEKRPISISEIAKKSGMHRYAVARNLDVLEILGKVRKIQKGTAKKYFLFQSLPVSGLIDISSDLIIIVNPNLEIQYLNNAALRYFSLSPPQILGEKLSLGGYSLSFPIRRSYMNWKIIPSKKLQRKFLNQNREDGLKSLSLGCTSCFHRI